MRRYILTVAMQDGVEIDIAMRAPDDLTAERAARAIAFTVAGEAYHTHLIDEEMTVHRGSHSAHS